MVLVHQVDLDSVTRKRALFALKRSLPTVSKVIAGNGNQNRDPLVNAQQVLSRREKWAQQEATALGLVVPEDRGSGHANSGHRWNAFVLLYEALEEYGTHLVEATWNLQVVCNIRQLVMSLCLASRQAAF